MRSILLALVILGCGGPATGNDAGPPDAGSDGGPQSVDAGHIDPLRLDCEPLVPEVCALPFPSMWFLRPDTTTTTGYRVHLGPTTLPAARGGRHQPVPADILASRDGFSVNASILAYLPGATAYGLPNPDAIADSLLTSSPTIVLDAETGTLVPHFSEIDMSTMVTTSRTLIIRPVVPLEHARRYIVAIRHVVDASAAEITPAPVFAALRDGTDFDHDYVRQRRADFEDIFTKLTAAGVERDSLQLAWDFVTVSQENDVGWLLEARDQALAVVGRAGPAYTIDMVERDYDEHTAMRIQGRMTVPLYNDSAMPGARLSLDPGGHVVPNGTAQFPFLLRIPASASGATPVRPLQYGHGLVGDRFQADAGWLAEFADAHGYAVFAVDLVGMSTDDVAPITLAISTGAIQDFQTVPDRLTQGIVNELLAMRMMLGGMASDPMLQDATGSLIDTTAGYYTGDSQGGIFGGTYMAVSTDVTRGILGVPGQPYDLLLTRSVDFAGYLALLNVGFNDGADIQVVLNVMQQLWDRTEPGSFTRHIATDLFPGTPAHQVVLEVAIGDHQVSPLGAHVMARAIGAHTLEPQTRAIWGIDEAPSPAGGSIIVEHDFGLPIAPITNVPPSTTSDDPHGLVRKLAANLAQSDHFFRTGEIAQTCTETCDPE